MAAVNITDLARLAAYLQTHALSIRATCTGKRWYVEFRSTAGHVVDGGGGTFLKALANAVTSWERIRTP
jgi:hypothetical protein